MTATLLAVASAATGVGAPAHRSRRRRDVRLEKAARIRRVEHNIMSEAVERSAVGSRPFDR
jgi:hypothetical protein